MVAEIAYQTGCDPKDMWNYGEPSGSYPIDAGRLRRVVAEKGEWGRTLPPGHGLGIAAHRSFVSYIATIVDGCRQ